MRVIFAGCNEVATAGTTGRNEWSWIGSGCSLRRSDVEEGQQTDVRRVMTAFFGGRPQQWPEVQEAIGRGVPAVARAEGAKTEGKED